ncbi:hypothetical protein ACIBK8_25615 [Streptomyces sp. NPDC050161]|uniref:hypothetical protein n=1 Tax=Streptomyces sp. NPDC050161 TaxID=3365604 RepID=UPI003788B37F
MHGAAASPHAHYAFAQLGNAAPGRRLCLSRRKPPLMPDDLLPSLPERLFVLASAFTRHNDALAALPLSGPKPTKRLLDHIPFTQLLASNTLDALDALDAVREQGLHRSTGVRDAEMRLIQIASLAVAAADHLIDAMDTISAARAEATGDDAAHGSYQDVLTDAGNQLRTARDLTALAPRACAETAESLAAELHRQGHATATSQHRPALPPAQHAALRAIARGEIYVFDEAGKKYANSREGRAPIATIHALASRNLLWSRQRPDAPGRYRLHLSPAGHRALAAAAVSRPPLAPLSTKAAARPALATPPASRRR